MRMSLRKVARLALIGAWGLVGLCQGAGSGRALAAAPPEKTLPGSTFAFLKINNAADFRASLGQSQLGQLWADPAMKPLKDDLAAKLDDASKDLKTKLGVSLGELYQLPQGAVSVAVVAAKEGAKPPFAILVSADAGSKADTMKGVLTRATKLAEDSGNAKVSTETFKDLTLHVMRSTKEGDKDEPPAIWTSQGSVYHFATDADALKDLLSHADGREDSLADSESFQQVRKKVGDEAQLVWFVDVAQVIKLAARSANANGGGNANAQQLEAQLQVTGINGLKAVGGSLAFNVGKYDMVTKLFVSAPAPVQGVLKLFSMPPTDLKPEPWVPASASSYESISWDLDAAYKAIDDLANMINPGLLAALEQQIAGPNGGEGLSFQKDLFGPLGDRITIVSDFKKKPNPKNPEDNQRTLFAVALEDSKAFRNTLNKVIGMAKLNPKKRDFQGTTIYDFDLSDIQGGGAGGLQLDGPLSVAVAKEACFVATDPTLLEQVLRSGGPRLADSAEFQAVAKEIPDQASTLSYTRPEEAVRQLYDMVKSGNLQKAFQQAAANKGQNAPKLDNLIDKDKLPEFSAISKYLSQSGGYGVMGEDGFLQTSFSLRKANP